MNQMTHRLEANSHHLLTQFWITLEKKEVVGKQEIILDFTKGVEGVETNVYLTIKDDQGKRIKTLYGV